MAQNATTNDILTALEAISCEAAAGEQGTVAYIFDCSMPNAPFKVARGDDADSVFDELAHEYDNETEDTTSQGVSYERITSIKETITFSYVQKKEDVLMNHIETYLNDTTTGINALNNKFYTLIVRKDAAGQIVYKYLGQTPIEITQGILSENADGESERELIIKRRQPKVFTTQLNTKPGILTASITMSELTHDAAALTIDYTAVVEDCTDNIYKDAGKMQILYKEDVDCELNWEKIIPKSILVDVPDIHTAGQVTYAFPAGAVNPVVVDFDLLGTRISPDANANETIDIVSK